MDLVVQFFAGAEPLLVTAAGEAHLPGRWCREHAPALLPGSFDPVHEGHWELARRAGEILGRPVAFELSVTNVDKPPLTVEGTRRRLGQFAGRADVWLTRAPRFIDKAGLFPGAAFVIGADTALRLVSPRYYNSDTASVSQALQALRGQQCHFLVAGRTDAAGRFVTVADIDVPAGFDDLFQAIPEQAFRVDVSSSQLRIPRA
jgi:hypothetical protein